MFTLFTFSLARQGLDVYSVHMVAIQSTTYDPLSENRSLEHEHGFEPLRVEGKLPAGLEGTLYRNGPGLFEHHGKRYSHPFIADGAITAIRIADGKAHGAARIHATAGLVEERAAGKHLYG